MGPRRGPGRTRCGPARLPAALLLGLGLALPRLGGAAALVLLLLAAVPLARAAPVGGAALRCGYGLGLALLLAPTVLPGAGAVDGLLAAVEVLCLGPAGRSAGWLLRTGRGHLGSAATLAEFRARMRPVLPVAVLLHLAVVGMLTFAALAVVGARAPRPGPAGGLLHDAALRASTAQWGAQAAVALLLVLVTALWGSGRAVLAACVPVAAGVAALVLGVLLPQEGAAGARLLACGGAAALLAPYTWSLFGRPGAYRAVLGPPGG